MEESFANNVETFSYDILYCNNVAFWLYSTWSLQLRVCKFSSKVVKTVSKVALRKPLSGYCNKFLEITDQGAKVNINECHSLIVNNWHYSIIDKMNSNIIVLEDMNDVRDNMKECTFLGMNDVNDIMYKYA